MRVSRRRQLAGHATAWSGDRALEHPFPVLVRVATDHDDQCHGTHVRSASVAAAAEQHEAVDIFPQPVRSTPKTGRVGDAATPLSRLINQSIRARPRSDGVTRRTSHRRGHPLADEVCGACGAYSPSLSPTTTRMAEPTIRTTPVLVRVRYGRNRHVAVSPLLVNRTCLAPNSLQAAVVRRLYVMRANGAAARPLTIVRGQHLAPSWQPLMR